MLERPVESGGMAEQVRSHDWDTTSLGPLEMWPDRLKLMVELTLANPLASSVVCGADRLLIYNDAASHVLGVRHPGALGRPLAEIFPQSWTQVAPLFERAFAGESVPLSSDVLNAPENEPAEAKLFNALLIPVRDAHGAVAYVQMTGTEIAAELHARSALIDSDRRARALLSASHQVIYEHNADWSEMRQLSGGGFLADTERPDPTWFDRYIHPDDQPHVCAVIQEAIRTKSIFDLEHRVLQADGSLGWTRSRSVPILDDRGDLRGWYGAASDETARKNTEAALRDSEELRRIALKSGGMGAWTWDTQNRVVKADDDFQHFWGLSPTHEPHPVSFYTDRMHPESAAVIEAVTNRALAPDEEFHDQVQVAAGPTAGRWIQWRGRADRLRPWLVNGVSFDVTAQKAAEEHLQNSEKLLRTITNALPAFVWFATPDGDLQQFNDRWYEYTGQTQKEALPNGWMAVVHPDDVQRTAKAWANARAQGLTYETEVRYRRRDGTYRWYVTRAEPLRNAQGSVTTWVGTSTDINDLRTYQERQQVLVAELQHRTRNLMGVVRSMADRTAEASSDLADFHARFRDRLGALARVQGLLSRLGEADRITFDELILTEIKAMNGDAERVTLEGREGIRLRSSMAQTLAMALHELATNALKYGALGQSEAALAIRWHTTTPDHRGRPWLHIDWRESGVRMPAPGPAPQGAGQGRELIEEALPYQLGAETRFALTMDGVHCTISIPVSASNIEREACHA